MFLKTYQKGTYTGVIELQTQTMHFYKGIPSTLQYICIII